VAHVLVVNPYASAVTPARVQAVARILGVADVIETEHRGHATELVRSASVEADRVYVFSGDGGFNEALNGLAATVPVGLVPGGGASVLARALGLPRDPERAARRLLAGRPRRISLGRVNGRRFGFACGIGLDAEIVRRVDDLGRTRERGRVGNLAFAWTGARVLAERRFRLPEVLELHGHGRAAFALVANCDPYTYAGAVPLRVAPLARFELGLDVVAPRKLTPAALPRFALYVLRGRGQERADDVAYLHDVDAVRITADRPLPLQADGEDLGDATEVVVEAERDAVTVLT